MSLVEVKDANDPQYLDVEDLKTKSVSGLDEIYRKGTAPNVTELEGRYDGVVLAGRMPFMDNTTSVKIANSPLVRWGGKKFDVVSENLAEGTNWFDLGLFEIDANWCRRSSGPATATSSTTTLPETHHPRTGYATR